MNSVFQQKQRELVLAVSKVEELTRQLEMLRSGRMDGRHDSRSAAAELDRLYKELQVCAAASNRESSWKGGILVSFPPAGGSKPQRVQNKLQSISHRKLRHFLNSHSWRADT